MSTGSDLIAMIASRQNLADYQKKHWHGTFAEYLDIVRHDPKVTRTAYQRLYDMILSHGTEEVVVNKEKHVRYKFFDDLDFDGQDAIFGLERTLMSLVNILKSAAQRYGTERRVLLLHGPGGQLQEHDRPAPEEGPGALLARPTRGPSTPTAGARRGSTGARRMSIARCTRSRST